MPSDSSLENLSYLYTEGCFWMPDARLRNELLRCYIEYIHPNLPYIDDEEVLKLINQNTEADSQTSLLLLQSLFFVASAFADKDMLYSAGFDSRIVARQVFYVRSKVNILRGLMTANP